MRSGSAAHWIQKFFHFEIYSAMAMPRPKTKSQVADDQRIKFSAFSLINREVIRLWDNLVPISGQQRD
jgi:hypothetical protein